MGRNYHESDIFRKLRFHDNKVDANVETAVQLLSIDDNRKVFQPLLWDGRHGQSSVEQIWIPGVHGDLGGLGDTFLGDVAFLTMIDRIKKKKDLDVDQDYIKSFIDRLGAKHGRISVSNERADAKMRALRHAIRQPLSNQYENKLHSIFSLLCGQKIYVRGRRRHYSCAPSSAFTDLPVATTSFDNRVNSAFFDVVQRMGP